MTVAANAAKNIRLGGPVARVGNPFAINVPQIKTMNPERRIVTPVRWREVITDDRVNFMAIGKDAKPWWPWWPYWR